MKNKTKAPAFQFFAADYLADASVQLMTLEEEGAYIRLLAYCWREGSLPSDDGSLSRLCKGASLEVIAAVKTRFTVARNDSSRLVHLRLEKTRSANNAWRKKCELAGRKSGEARRKSRVKQPEEVLKVSSDLVQLNSNSSSSSSSSPSGIITGTPREADESEEPAGTEPSLEKFIAAAALYMIPPGYARKKWEVQSAKGWCIGRTPAHWRKILPLVKRDYENDGRPQDSVPGEPAKPIEPRPVYEKVNVGI